MLQFILSNAKSSRKLCRNDTVKYTLWNGCDKKGKKSSQSNVKATRKCNIPQLAKKEYHCFLEGKFTRLHFCTNTCTAGLYWANV